MAREKAPAFQWYPKDFLADGPCAAMSCAETGAYARLLSFCWLEHSLPADDRRLARMAGATVREWEQVKAAVLERFETGEDGRLRHGRLDTERQAQAEWRAKSSNGGRTTQAKRNQPANQTSTKPQPIGQPNVNTPSPSSDVHTTHNAHEAPLGSRREHAAHAMCGRVCLPGFILREFLNAKGGEEEAARAYVDTWAMGLIRAIAPGGPREAEVIGDPLKWWRYQWEAGHKTAKPDGKQAKCSGRLPSTSDAYGWCEHEPRCGTVAGHDLKLAREAREVSA